MRYPFPEVIDSSIMGVYKSCPQKVYKEYIANWKSKGPSIHLHAGGAFARGMEVARLSFYVDGLSADAAVAAGRDALAEFYGDFDAGSHAKSLSGMIKAFDFYFANYPLAQDHPPIILPGGRKGIEFSFAEPLPILHPETGNPLIYCGRMDAILSAFGGQFICDEKTTTSLGPTWGKQWDLRAQFTGYVWGCGKAGIHIDGALIRGVSILKTKNETQQAISYRPEFHVERWYEELLEWVEEMIGCWKKDKWRHNLDHACADYGGCAFRQVCTYKEEAAVSHLETFFERRFWNPLTRTETLL